MKVKTQIETADELSAARFLIAEQSRALATLSQALDSSIIVAADQILACRGRVVVCGIGKSGIAAQKIVATLASLGTPAMFLHAGEAVHGDLGKLVAGDILIAISVSGETAEVLAVVGHAASMDIPVIAVSMTATSSLSNQASMTLLLPEVAEMSPGGAAPMASTLMTIALGDALASILAVRAGFSRGKLVRLHPGGSIGRRLRPVSRVMHGGERMPLVFEDASIDEILTEIDRKGLGIVGVVEAAGGALTGVITDGDLRRHYRDADTQSAGQLSSKTPVTVFADTEIGMALSTMRSNRISAIFVIDPDDGVPIGIVHVQDLLRIGIF